MSVKNIKKQNPHLDINIVDMLVEIGGSKMLPFLVKMFNKGGDLEMLKEHIKHILGDYLGNNNIRSVETFRQHLENNRVENTDITSYSDWSDILSEISKAELKMVNKELKKEVNIIHEDDEWLLLKPLSFTSSLAYGSNTKWCVAMKSEPEYFYRYSKRGILIYVLNKKTGVKTAFYNSDEGKSVWNQMDDRIDSMDVDIPLNLLGIIKNELDLDKNMDNFELFSDKSLEEYQELVGKYEIKKCEYVANPDYDQTMAPPIELGARAAIRV